MCTTPSTSTANIPLLNDYAYNNLLRRTCCIMFSLWYFGMDTHTHSPSLIHFLLQGHCLDGGKFFTENAVMGRTLLPIAQMYETYGIRPETRNNIQNVTFYVMSSNDDLGKSAGQFWTTMETFPTPKMTDFFLHSDGSSGNTPPSEEESSATPSTSYKVDPADPILTIGGNNLPPDIGGSIHCGPEDQSPVDSRADVLVFNTPVFEEHFYITGAMSATLFVSSDAIDTDFMVILVLHWSIITLMSS